MPLALPSTAKLAASSETPLLVQPYLALEAFKGHFKVGGMAAKGLGMKPAEELV